MPGAGVNHLREGDIRLAGKLTRTPALQIKFSGLKGRFVCVALRFYYVSPGFLLAAHATQAQVYKETWAGLTATSPTATGTTTMAGGSFNTRINDSGSVVINTTNPFPGLADTKSISWNGLSDVVFNVTYPACSRAPPPQSRLPSHCGWTASAPRLRCRTRLIY